MLIIQLHYKIEYTFCNLLDIHMISGNFGHSSGDAGLQGMSGPGAGGSHCWPPETEARPPDPDAGTESELDNPDTCTACQVHVGYPDTGKAC